MVRNKYNDQSLDAKPVLYVPKRLFNMPPRPPPRAVKQKFETIVLFETDLSNTNLGDIPKLSGANVLESFIQCKVLKENPGNQ